MAQAMLAMHLTAGIAAPNHCKGLPRLASPSAAERPRVAASAAEGAQMCAVEYTEPSGNDITEVCRAYLDRLVPPRPEVWTPFV